MGVSLGPSHEALLAQFGDDGSLSIGDGQADEALRCVTADPAVLVDHAQPRQLVANADLTVRKAAWKEIQDIVNTQAWVVWLPTVNAKLPMSNRFGNAKPSPITHRLIWNIDQVYVKQR